MAMTGTFKMRGGEPYVLSIYEEHEEPIRRRIWWRVRGVRGFAPNDGHDVYFSRDGYWVSRGGQVFTGGEDAETVERVPVPPPPARGKQLRWHDGRWERLLAKGWVPAGQGQAQSRPGMKTKGQLNREIEQATGIRIRES